MPTLLNLSHSASRLCYESSPSQGGSGGREGLIPFNHCVVPFAATLPKPNQQPTTDHPSVRPSAGLSIRPSLRLGKALKAARVVSGGRPWEGGRRRRLHFTAESISGGGQTEAEDIVLSRPRHSARKAICKVAGLGKTLEMYLR